MSKDESKGWSSPKGAPIDQVLERSLLDKLSAEISHYQNRDMIEAAMAACALVANSDDEVHLAERCAVGAALRGEPALQDLDADLAKEILDGYGVALRQNRAQARAVLTGKVAHMAGDHKRSRTLMRIAYLVITADYVIKDEEKLEFRRLCGVLGLEPDQVWRNSQAMSARHADFGLS